MVKKNNSLFYIALIVSIVIVAYLVWAATGSSSIIVEPTSNSNHSANFVVNITWNSSELNQSDWNMTFCYVNVSGSWTRIGWPTGNASAYNNYSLETHMYINFTQSITNITDANGLALNCTVGNLTANLSIQTSNMSTLITIDDTPPNVTASPTTNTNYSNLTTNISGVILLNFTVKDNVIGFDNGSMHNVFFNLTKGGVQNATFRAEQEGSTGYWSNDTGFNLSAYTEGNYTIAIFANDSLGNLNSTINTSIIWIDNTRPDVNASNISSPVIGRNYSDVSGLLVLNVTVRDALTHVSNVSFVIKNSTGSTNNTVTAAQEGSTGYGNSTAWSVSINTSHYPDSNYTITVYANDSAGNTNTSADIIKINFDNTVPSLTYTCSPSSVEVGNTVTCSCGGTDVTSGINSSSFSYTSSPPTSASGVFSVSCSGYDQAGNSNSLTTSYTVTGAGGGGGGGGGGGTTTSTWSSTTEVTSQEFNTGYSKSLGSKQRLKVTVNNENHYVGVLSLTTDTATVEVSSTPQKAIMRIGETRKFDVTGNGYYDIQVTVNKIENSKAELRILSVAEKVPESALPSPEEETAAGEEEPAPGVTAGATSTTTIIIIAIIVIIGVVAYIIYRKSQ